jgi:hypothetical protein
MDVILPMIGISVVIVAVIMLVTFAVARWLYPMP